MTKQDKIDYKNPITQNLFLLTQNKKLQKDLEQTKRKHKTELKRIIRQSKVTKLIIKEVGSQKLQQDIEKICKRIAFYNRPERLIVRSIIVYFLSEKSIKPFLLEIEKNKYIKTIIHKPWMKVYPDKKGVVIQLSISLYHSKETVVDFILKNWDEIIKMKKVLGKKMGLGIDKLQPYTDFERDWQILIDKEDFPYSQLAGKYSYDIDTIKIIVRKLRRRIKNLYSSS